jgi:hypothetical protein
MGASGQPHGPAALYPGKATPNSINQKAGYHSRWQGYWEKKVVLLKDHIVNFREKKITNRFIVVIIIIISQDNTGIIRETDTRASYN